MTTKITLTLSQNKNSETQDIVSLRYKMAQKSFCYKLIGPRMIQPIISFLSLKHAHDQAQQWTTSCGPMLASAFDPCLTSFSSTGLRQTLPQSTRGWAHIPWQQLLGSYLFDCWLKTFAMPGLFVCQRLWSIMRGFITDFMKSIKIEWASTL